MHRLRVYVDNSVYGGVFDEEFAEASQRFFEQVKAGRYIVLISEVVFEEIEDAPERVQRILRDLPADALEEIALTPQVYELSQAYVAATVLSPKWAFDAIQVAAATVAGADLILSWNFEHLVNFDRIRGFNAVNLMRGYKTLDIRTPKELGHGDQDQDL
jgi:hypothetical protein